MLDDQDNMNDLVEDFLSICLKIIEANQAQVKSLQQHGFQCEPFSWQFRLPDLFQYLYLNASSPDAVTYKQFRQMLFASDLNARLRLQHAEIAIALNTGKVDKNIYWLRMSM